MLEYLERLAKTDRSRLHLLITSRPCADIQSYMVRMKTHQLDLQAVEEQVDDLRVYVSYELEKMKWGDTLVRLAFDTLTAKANGSFRWVACQIDSLRTCLRKHVKLILQSLPKDLEETYQRILDRIPPNVNLMLAASSTSLHSHNGRIGRRTRRSVYCRLRHRSRVPSSRIGASGTRSG
ncbi:hypothetical protein B0H17DRAFT_555803 [Mycena rosella]|uniref:Uncharacterized protein n=1 Tax=Mycena rosella TaxID=1033263 RepID=A0AAD7GJB9_MYCRO|nr:hypothetical protein B0H17DRAFT_555803 [Mycena rosella]